MSDGGLLKPEKDFSKDADKLIPEAEQLAKVRSICFLVVNLVLTLSP
jgi:hypothetical protein